MSLTSAVSGIDIEVHLMLRVSLSQYPTSIPALFAFKLVYRECMPTEFLPPVIYDLTVFTGEPAFNIEYVFDQSPCTWSQSY